MRLTVNACAKLNLWLDITGKRPDGYHTLNTVMRRIDLCDDVTVETMSGGDITIVCDDPTIPVDDSNVAYRAVRVFCAKFCKEVGVRISIVKRIPVCAGLGGSSADGAAVLTALNEICGRPMSVSELRGLGASLGADVPFCIAGGTAKCTGIGEIMQPIPCEDFTALVVLPDFSCSTPAAYRRYDDSPIAPRPGFDKYCAEIGASRTYAAENLYNVFERLYCDERIGAIKERLMECGAEGACMTGSGSAVFGIFPDSESVAEAAARFDGFKTFIVRGL